MPAEQTFQFDTDEGVEVMKSSLYSQGFKLYTEIWNEQPPLFTVLLSYWFRVFGKSIFAGRLLVLSFSTLLIWSFCQTLRTCVGGLPALIGTLFLSLSCNFLRLSVSVMIGLPSLALAMVAIYTLILYQQKPRLYLIVLSGCFLALSLQTKLFTVFLVPLLAFQLLEFSINEWHQKEAAHVFYPFISWLLSLLGVFTLTGLLFHSLNFEQLVQANIGGNVKAAFILGSDFRSILLMLLEDIDYALLVIPGVVVALKKKQWFYKFPLIWLVTITLILLNQKPLWYHYYLLVSIPLVWLATYGVTLVFEYLRQVGWHSIKLQNIQKLTLSGFAVTSLIFSMIAIPVKLTFTQAQNHSFAKKLNSNIETVAHLLEHKLSTHWVFTDLPIFAFYANLNVPPEIAVFSKKRLESGYLTVDKLHTVLKTYQPEQIVLGRFPSVQGEISSYIYDNYSKINGASPTHYLLKQRQN